MIFMNEYEIEEAQRILRAQESPAADYADYLAEFCDTVNQNSDGWPYFTRATRAAAKLQEALQREMRYIRVGQFGRESDQDRPTAAELRKSLTPIKSFCTRQGWPKPTAL